MNYVSESSNLILRIKHYYPVFSETQIRIADFIIGNPKELVHLSVSDVAEVCQVSEATVVRFSKTIGFSGFRDMKLAYALEPQGKTQIIHEEITPADTPYDVFSKVCKSVYNSLEDTQSLLSSNDRDLSEAVDLLLHAQRILIIGMGSSSYVALDLHHKLLRLGLVSMTYSDPHLQMIAAMSLQEGDAVVAISNSGASREILETVNVAKQRGAAIISILRYGESPLLHQTDYPLFIAAREAPFHMLPMSSRIAQLSYVDSMYIMLAMRAGLPAIEHVNQVESLIKKTKI